MGEDRKKRTGLVLIKIKRAMPLLLWVVGIAFVCLVGGLVAKYMVSIPRGDNQIGAQNFYFTLDLLTATEELAGQDENGILERTIDLYGQGQKSLTFTVQNFYDDLRINIDNVAYQISWDDGLSVVEAGKAAAVKEAYNYFIKDGSALGNRKYTRTYTATFNDTTQAQTAVITVRAISRYEKAMKLKLVFHPEQYDVRYRVEDEPGAVYARLIVMVGKAEGVAAEELLFDWTAAGDALQIDTTNTNILQDNNGELTVPTSLTINQYQLPNTQPVEASGSISILFFKTDPTQNYAKADTVAELENGAYKIVIGPTS